MKPDVDYKIDHRYRDIELTEQGKAHICELTEDLTGLWKANRRSLELINQALIARELYLRDQHYVINDIMLVTQILMTVKSL